MSLVVFPFKSEDPSLVLGNMSIATANDAIQEVWAVAAEEGGGAEAVRQGARDLSKATSKTTKVLLQERVGTLRPGKGDAMNTAMARAAEEGWERVHFYDADITNFDSSWIDGAEAAADRGYGVVRHRFPRAATDAMITWMVTRPGLALMFPGTILPRLGQPLGGELLMTRPVVEALASDSFVTARSDWGIDTVITHATAALGLDIYEHNAPGGKRHALYGALTDIEDMVLECLDAVASLWGRGLPEPGPSFEADPPAPVPDDLKQTVAYDLESTRASISAQPGPEERTILESLGVDPEAPIEMGHEPWRLLLPRLLAQFQLTDPAWRKVVFRLWVERVIHYTTNQVPAGYDAAMTYLESTILDFEQSSRP